MARQDDASLYPGVHYTVLSAEIPNFLIFNAASVAPRVRRPTSAARAAKDSPLMDIQWQSSVPASALYAALVLQRGRTLVDPGIESALRPIASRLQSELTNCGYQVDAVLWHMISLVDPYVDDSGDTATLAERAARTKPSAAATRGRLRRAQSSSAGRSWPKRPWS